jgi:TM2 domain-containing membrane protein YozV
VVHDSPRYRNAVTEQPNGRIRVGAAERDAAMKALGKHMETGHLEVDEYTERVNGAATARTVAELDELFVDLPAPHYRTPPTPPHAMYQPQPTGFPADIVRSSSLYGHECDRPLSYKSKLAAGLLQILLPFGVGRFYTGHFGMAVAQLCLSLIWVGIIWSVVDGILILAQGGIDSQGRQLRS